MAELEVSPATLKRDLQYLRDRMQRADRLRPLRQRLPLRAAAPPTAARPRHELPGVWFSEREIHALLTMHQLLAGLDDDGVLARHLQPLLEKLQGMLGAERERGAGADARVKIVGAARRRGRAGTSSSLGSALLSAGACG